MSDNIRADFIRKRKDPKFMSRSDQAKRNRLSNQSQKFDPGHRQGSVSTVEVAERLAAKANGVLPAAATVYEKTHGFEMPDGETVLLGDKPQQIMDEYQEKLDDYKDKGIEKAPNEVFLEVVGGPKKGKVYGLGNASSLFYEVGRSQSKQSPHVSSLISQLSSQLEECKKMVEESKKIAEDNRKIAENSLKIAQATQKEYEKEKEEWKKEKQELVTNVAKVKKVAEEVFHLLEEERSLRSRHSHDPSTGRGFPFTTT